MQQLLVTGVPLQWKADTLATFVQRQLGKRHSRGGRGFSLKKTTRTHLHLHSHLHDTGGARGRVHASGICCARIQLHFQGRRGAAPSSQRPSVRVPRRRDVHDALCARHRRSALSARGCPVRARTDARLRLWPQPQPQPLSKPVKRPRALKMQFLRLWAIHFFSTPCAAFAHTVHGTARRAATVHRVKRSGAACEQRARFGDAPKLDCS
jgi:hypothetical protein